MATARELQANIQRRHRVQRRHDEEPSQTPNLQELALQQQQRQDLQAELPLLQPNELGSLPERRPIRGRNRGRPSRHGPRNRPESSRPSGSIRGRGPGRPSRPRNPVGRPRLARNPVGRPPLSRNPVGRPRAHPEPDTPLRDFDEMPPVYNGNDQEAPITQEDVDIKKQFDEALAAEKMVYCPRCQEKWFDIHLLRDGICKKCHGKDDKKEGGMPDLYSAANHLDFGDVPPSLPPLEPLEELFIARVHVSVNIYTVSSSFYYVNIANSL